MAIKITLKNSVVQDSVPTTTHLAAVGELALNANINSLGIYMRASDNSIVKMAGPGSVTTPAASVTVAGIAELATSAETTTGTDTARVTTPAGVKAVTDAERTTSNNTYLAKAGGTLTGVVAATAGSNSAPAIHFGDSDSGIYGGTNTVSLAAGGTQGLTLNSSAEVNIPVKLGVNTASPTKALHVTSTGEIARFQSTNSSATVRLYSTASDHTELGHTGDFYIAVGGSERARIDASGRLLVGTSSARTFLTGYTPSLQVEGTANSDSAFGIVENVTSTSGPSFWFGKTRSASLGGTTTVQSGDELGTIIFNGADGTDLECMAGWIRGKASGTIAGNRMPGSLEFATTADSAGSVVPTTRLTITSAGVVNVPDNGKFTAGASDDLSIYHDSSNNGSYIKEGGAGNLYIFSENLRIENADGSDSYIEANNGGAVELYYDGVKKLETTSGGVTVTGSLNTTANLEAGNNIQLLDNKKLLVGNANDLQIYSDGTHGFMVNHVGGGIYIRANSNIQLSTNASDGGADDSLKCLNNGAVELYYDNSKKLHTFTGGVKFFGTLEADDSDKIKLGDNADLELYHDGTHSYIKNSTGYILIESDQLQLRAYNGETMLDGAANGAVEIRYDDVKKFETTSYGFTSSGYSSIGDGTWAYLTGDSNKSAWGSDQDLQIWHDGSHGYLDNDTGWMHLFSDNFAIKDKSGGDAMIYCHHDGAIELYHDGEKKVVTSSSGLEIYGTDGGAATLDLRSDEGANDTDQFRFHVDDGGPLYIRNKYSGSWETNIMCAGNGRVELYYDNAKQCETNSGGMNWADGKRAYFGNSSDLQIYHGTDSHSYISNTTGNLYVNSNEINFSNVANNEFIARFITDGACMLYHDNVKKLETTQYGIEINGAPSALKATGAGECQVLLGSTGAGGAAIYFDGDSNGDFSGSDYSWIKHNTSGDMEYMADAPAGATNHVFRSQNGSVFTVRSDKDVEIHDGNLKLANGHGINFYPYDTTQSSPGSDHNLLSDYERGTWTPADGSSGALTLVIGSASYCKVGDLVFINFYVSYPTNSDGATAYITGLPFTPKGATNYSYLTGRIGSMSNGVAVQVNSASASCHVYVGDTAYLNSQLSGKYILVSGCYSTA